ncbi:MAG: hypothetical protein AAB861_00705 [Patescibacteria group bacterium]
MATATINRDFVTIPRKEYEEFSDWKIITGGIKTFKPTKADIKDIERGEREIKAGHYTPWSIVKNELVRIRNKKRSKTT